MDTSEQGINKREGRPSGRPPVVFVSLPQRLPDDIAVLSLLESPQTDGVAHVVEILIGVDIFPVHAGLKMQMLRSGSSRATCQCYHLSGLHVVAYLNHILGIVAIIGFQAIRMLDANQITIASIFCRKNNLSVEGCKNIVVSLRLQVRTRMLPTTTSAIRTDDLVFSTLTSTFQLFVF